jgi:hypothetical protein
MPNAVNWDAALTATSYLTTELNSLADGANKLGGVIDNSTNLEQFLAVEVSIAAQGVARDAGAHVAVYLLRTVDGTNYQYGSDSVDPPPDSLVATIAFDAATAARINMVFGILAPPGKCKLLLQNNTGQAFASSANTCDYSLYVDEIQ